MKTTDKPMCLSCKKNPAYKIKGFTSAWCPKCHLRKFGCTHEERGYSTLIKKLPITLK